MKTAIWAILSFSLSHLLTAVVAQSNLEPVKLTIRNLNPFAGNRALPVHYECFASEAMSVTFDFERYVYTRNAEQNSDYDPVDRAHGSINNARKVKIMLTSKTGPRAYGIFTCKGVLSGRPDTVVATIILRGNAYLHPGGFFTTTINQGETASLSVVTTAHDFSSQVVWRLDSGDEMNLGSLQLSTGVPGVYETYPTGTREEARGSIQRLIVRSCSAYKWGTDCVNKCPVCLNGGMCHDQSGVCICPPGFKGDRCQDACDLNKFGYNCELSCGAGVNSCSGTPFCLPDPYGCSCGRGYMGLECNTVCSSAQFGAGCKQECHCSGTGDCNRFTGVCINSVPCAVGWAGTNCQVDMQAPMISGCPGDIRKSSNSISILVTWQAPIATDNSGSVEVQSSHSPGDSFTVPSETPVYYFYTDLSSNTASCSFNVILERECSMGFYGATCTQGCHCTPTCDKDTGACTTGNACLQNWLDTPDNRCQTGVYSLSIEKVNPGQASNILCSLSGDVSNADASYVRIERSGSISTAYTSTTATQTDINVLTVNILVPTLQDEDVFTCQLTRSGAIASLSVQASVYALPMYIQQVTILSMTSSSIFVGWSYWIAEFGGDGPVIGYTLYYTRVETGITMYTSLPISPNTFTLGGLLSDSEYSLSIAAVRYGAGGEGPRGPENTVRTMCGVPIGPPPSLFISSSQSGTLTVTWMSPSAKMLGCRTAVPTISSFNIYHKAKNNPNGVLTGPLITETNMALVKNLKVYTEYDIYVTIVTEYGEGAINNPITAFTLEGVPPAPMVMMEAATFYSINITLDLYEPFNVFGNVDMYSVQWRMSSMMEVQGMSSSSFGGAVTMQHQIAPLQAETSYVIQVRVKNGAGEGSWSDELGVTTLQLTPPPPPVDGSFKFTAMDSSSVTLTWQAAQPEYVNGDITHFVIGYSTMTGNRRKREERTVDVPYAEFDGSYLLQGLEGSTTYSIWVATANVAGGGEQSDPIIVTTPQMIATTLRSMVTLMNPDPTESIIAVVAAAAVIIVALLVLVIVIRRRHSGSPKEPPDTSTAFPNKAYSDTESDSNKSGNGDSTSERRKSRTKNSMRSVDKEETDDDATKATVEVEDSLYMNTGSVLEVATFIQYVKEQKSRQRNPFKDEFDRLPEGQTAPWTVAENPINKKKNRFKNIISYDHALIKLQGEGDGDYVNATYIKDTKGQKSFIAAQGPTKDSIDDFWQLIWQEKVEDVVMLTNMFENGKDRCRMYWPSFVGEIVSFGNFEIKMKKEEHFAEHVERTLIVITDAKKFHTVKQYHYVTWPDMGVPQVASMYNFLDKIKKEVTAKENMTASEKIPLLVHCSAGVGRTGSFITIYHLLDVMQTEPTIDIHEFVLNMRKNRTNMVQTLSQYVFVHDALLHGHIVQQHVIPLSSFTESYHHLVSTNHKTNRSYLEDEFELLNEVSPTWEPEQVKDAENPEFAKRLRNTKYIALKGNRPYISTTAGVTGNEFINASLVHSVSKKYDLIVTQHPLSNTVEDFWCLVYDWKCSTVIMLNDIKCASEECEQYWPNREKSFSGGIHVAQEDMSASGEIVTRTFTVSIKGSKDPAHAVTHFQFTGWLEGQSAPSNITSLNDLVELVWDHKKGKGAGGPILIHCLYGTGRSGVFLTLWNNRENKVILKKDHINIFSSVLQYRAFIPFLLEDKELYKTIYAAVNNSLMNSTYENFNKE